MAVNVARVYEQTIRPGRSYCRICLRSGGETTLVTPHYILQFTEALKLNIFEGKKARTVCYLCEAYAGTALRVYQACVNAVSVKNACQPLKDMKPTDPVPEWLRKAILGCNANLKEYRKKTMLQQTEVLVVDSTGVEWGPEGASSSDQLTRIDVPLMPSRLPQQRQLETVVLDDDDETAQKRVEPLNPPTKTALPFLVPIENFLNPTPKDKTNLAALLPDQMQIISRHNDNVNFILHPVVIGEKGHLVAPSLGGRIVDGQLVYDAKTYRPMPLIDCTETRYIFQGSDLKLVQNNTANSQSMSEEEEILPDKGSKHYRRGSERRMYGSEQSRAHWNKKRAFDRSAGSKKKKTSDEEDSAKNKSQYVVDLDTVNNMIAENGGEQSNNDIDEDPIAVISNVTSNSEDPIAVISNVVSTSDPINGGGGAVTEVVSRGPQLVKKNIKIDWEDKIPMDVISFVDSTDPLVRDLIVPDRLPSHLRQAATQTPHVTPHTRREKSDQIIDLC